MFILIGDAIYEALLRRFFPKGFLVRLAYSDDGPFLSDVNRLRHFAGCVVGKSLFYGLKYKRRGFMCQEILGHMIS